ncbi:MAG TPA: hypothetical protein P5110_08555 [Candidatus Omnitrophota bacterium]|nr:hypothetical protein [Candidatus Omnitrophota bacterium]HRZ15540.1 hypothetical protein [Candidatus Omnitrophota bacterium]
MMTLADYLKTGSTIALRPEQEAWTARLSRTASRGLSRYKKAAREQKERAFAAFMSRVRTEELKAWYSSPENDSLFQGTSISSLTIPCEMDRPLELSSIEELEASIADSYISLHDKYAQTVRSAIVEDVEEWIREGLYYGVVLSSKIISQAFGLSMGYDDAVFKVGSTLVDPHEITAYPPNVREGYFKACLQRLRCFAGLNLYREELESSLVLADISKPRMQHYRQKIILAPVRNNEIAAILSERVTALIVRKSAGRIRPRGLTVVIYDTDTPYTYHQIMGYCQNEFFPVLPGLIVLGASGTIDAFRWLYAYRVSLIAQKIMKSSLYSQAHKKFIPFVFFGVLVPRDAQILLDMDNLHRLRYRGNIDPELEFSYLVEQYLVKGSAHRAMPTWDRMKEKHLF